jgi:hypothetical protein
MEKLTQVSVAYALCKRPPLVNVQRKNVRSGSWSYENSSARCARRASREKLRIMRAKSYCAHTAQHRVGELYFPHCADV